MSGLNAHRGATSWGANASRFLRLPARADMSVTRHEDPTCPECRGRKTDRMGFDCRRCAGEGVVDE